MRRQILLFLFLLTGFRQLFADAVCEYSGVTTNLVIAASTIQSGSANVFSSGGESFSVAATVRWNGQDAKQEIFSVTFGLNGNATYYRYGFRLDANRNFAAVYGANNKVSTSIGTDVPAEANKDYRFVMVRNDSTLDFYVAGEKIASTVLPAGCLIRYFSMGQETTPSGVLVDPNYDSQRLKGSMVFFGIYDVALTESKVAMLSDLSIPLRFTPDYDVVVLPLSTRWSQSKPFNDYAPDYTPIGCGATMSVQVFNYYKWPYRINSTSYSNSGSPAAELRFDGRVPLDWDGLSDVPSASTELVRYRQARPSFAAAVIRTMAFFSGGSTTTFFQPSLFLWGYTHLGRMVNSAYSTFDSDSIALETVVSQMKNSIFEKRQPIFLELGLNPQSHWVVGFGWAEDKNGHKEVLVNYGWGPGFQPLWVDVYNTKNETFYGQVRTILYNIVPKRMIQIDPLPRTSDSGNIGLSWKIPNLYTNEIDHLQLEIQPYSETLTDLTDDFNDGIVRNGDLEGPKITCVTRGLDDSKTLRFGTGVSGIYRTKNKVRLSSISELSFRWCSDYISGATSTNYTLYVQLSVDGTQWKNIYSVVPPTGNVMSGWQPVFLQLGNYGGEIAYLRILCHNRNGKGSLEEDCCVFMDDFALKNVGIPEDGLVVKIPAGTERWTVENALTSGKMYQFKVTPVSTNNSVFVSDAVTTRISGEGLDFIAGNLSESSVDDMIVDFSKYPVDTASDGDWTTTDTNFKVGNIKFFSKDLGNSLITGSYGSSPIYRGDVRINLGGRVITENTKIKLVDGFDGADSTKGDQITVSLIDGSETKPLQTFTSGFSYLNYYNINFATQTVAQVSAVAGKTGLLVITPSTGDEQSGQARFALKSVLITNLLTPTFNTVMTNRTANAFPEIVSFDVEDSVFFNANPVKKSSFTATVADESPATLTWHVESSRPDIISSDAFSFNYAGENKWKISITGNVDSSVFNLNSNRVLLTFSIVDSDGNSAFREAVVMFLGEGDTSKPGFKIKIL